MCSLCWNRCPLSDGRALYLISGDAYNVYKILGIYLGPLDIDMPAIAGEWHDKQRKQCCSDDEDYGGGGYSDEDFAGFVIERAGLVPCSYFEIFSEDVYYSAAEDCIDDDSVVEVKAKESLALLEPYKE